MPCVKHAYIFMCEICTSETRWQLTTPNQEEKQFLIKKGNNS